MAAWHRIVLRILTLIVHSTKQAAMDYLVSRPSTQAPKAKAKATSSKSKQIGDGKIRRGIGRELPRSKPCKSCL